MSLKEKLRSWLDTRWNYEIQCDVFDGLDRSEIEKIAQKYDIDISLSRIEICQRLAKILQAKKEEYESVLKDSGCINTMALSGTAVEDIDPRELLTITHNNQQYCFEIEGIYKNVFVNNNPKNPYTNVPFDGEALKLIENEYEKFKILKGKKFDVYAYTADADLGSIVNQLVNYLPYLATGVDVFLKADRGKINEFISILSANYVIIPGLESIYPEDEDISVEYDTKLREYKIKLAQKLIRWIVENDYVNVREAWSAAFEEQDDDYELDPELMLAIQRNSDISEIEELVNMGASVDFQDSSGNTPIAYAIENNSYDVVKYLIENGANLYTIDIYDQSPLYIALKKGDKGIIALILENLEMIDDPNIRDIVMDILDLNDIALVETLFEKDIDPDMVINNEGDTILIYSIKAKLNPEIVDFIMEKGASLENSDVDGNTPLMIALKQKYYDRELIQTMIDLTDDLDTENIFEETPVQLAKSYPGLVNMIKKSMDEEQ